MSAKASWFAIPDDIQHDVVEWDFFRNAVDIDVTHFWGLMIAETYEFDSARSANWRVKWSHEWAKDINMA